MIITPEREALLDEMLEGVKAICALGPEEAQELASKGPDFIRKDSGFFSALLNASRGLSTGTISKNPDVEQLKKHPKVIELHSYVPRMTELLVVK
jgi:hypothetical protein